MIKAIVFDFDGVIVDSEPLHYQAFCQVVRPMGIELTYPWYCEHLIGYDDRDAFRVLLVHAAGGDINAGPAAYDGDESQVTRLKQQKAHVFEQIVRAGVTPIEGVVHFIQAASAAMPVAISSGATQADIALVLKVIGLEARFDPIVTADDVARSKPDPQSYALAVRGLADRCGDGKLRPDQCVAIEDTVAGIESARGAGLWALGLTTTSEPSRLQRAHRLIDSFAALSIEQLQHWFGDA